jgi:integrator complex subunit 7
MLCSKASSNHHANGSELSKLLLAAESSLDSSLEMQGTALEILVQIFCILKEVRSDNISVLKGSSFAYAEWQGVMNNIPLTEENSMNGPLCKLITLIVNHILSLVKEVASRNICISSEVDKAYKTPFRLMLKLVSCYPSAAAVALDILKSLVKELFLINGSDYAEVSVTSVEPFQTSVALEELSNSDDNVQLLAKTIEASCTEPDIGNGKLDFLKFECKNRKSIMHDLIRCTLKFANACHEVLCETSGARYNPHDSIKGLIKYVHQDAPQQWSTYESFHLIMCACVTRNTCKISGGNQESGDSKEHPNTLFAPSVWITQELCALRMTKMLIKKQKYWEAYRSSMYCCRKGLWFTASFVFRKLADAFEAGSFSFWLKSLLLLSAGEIEMKLLIFPLATIKLVGELKTVGDFSEDLFCTETDADSTLSRSSELHGFQAKISDISGRTLLANNALASSASSDHDFLFQRWFISLRSSFLEVLTNVLDILSAHSSYEARGDHLTLSGEFIKDQVLALDHCSLRLSDLAKSYDLLAASHMDLDQHSSSSIARLAFMCSLLAFCTAYSVYFSKACNYVESCKLPKRFSHASILQDLHGRVDGSDWQVVSQLRQFMSTSFDELDSLQSSTRISCTFNLEKDMYSLCHFAVASLLGVCGSAEAEEIQNGEDCLSALQGGLQVLSSILQKYMELPFVVPKYFFRVR